MNVEALASELGWSEVPEGAAGAALELLLDDEFDRLKPAEREAFVTQVRARAPAAEGSNLAICAGCQNAILVRYVGRDCRCRACGAALDVGGDGSTEDSGFGFSLEDYGTHEGATLLSEPPADPEGGRLELHTDRSLDEALELDDDNQDWDDLQDEIEARREAEEEARLAGVETAKRDAAEKVRLAAETARLAAEAAAEKVRLEAAAAAEKVRLAAEAAAEKARLAAEEAAREKAAEEARLVAEEAARKKAAEEARLAAEEAERERIRELEKARPALGCVAGERAGKVIRLPDLEGDPVDKTAIYVVGWPKEAQAVLYVGQGEALVDGKPASGRVELELGAVVTMGGEAHVVEETAEMGSQQAAAIHLARNDKQPGGPWAYWNEEIRLGALSNCEINVVDDGVADVHARVLTRFGIVVLDDQSGRGSEDGVYVNGEREPWLLLHDGVTFKLGPRGPELVAKAGAARQKAGQKAKAMKPARHNRTVLDVFDANDVLLQRVFVFVRREVRFGAIGHSPDDETRLVNEWVLHVAPHEAAEIADKQGGLALTRDGVDVRRDGGAEMLLNGESLEPGSPQPLRRRFDLEIGERMTFDGRVYRSPSAVEREEAPPRLGMKGGHPTECVRLDRVDTEHTYVFLVRMLRIGSESFAPLRIDLPGVAESHCQIMFSQGKYLIVAPKASAPVFLGDVEVDTGIAFPLEINTDVHVGDARLRFREATAADFAFETEDKDKDED